MAGALIAAWRLYKQTKSVILFLVEDVTYNVCDQKFHEFEIRRQCPEVFVIRRTLTEIGTRGKLTDDKRLIIDGQEVGVIYMRCGYHPDQYPTGDNFYPFGISQNKVSFITNSRTVFIDCLKPNLSQDDLSLCMMICF